LLSLFWGWKLANYLPAWPLTTILLISASQVARFIGMSHQSPAVVLSLPRGWIPLFNLMRKKK
jgi:hypothetical protein